MTTDATIYKAVTIVTPTSETTDIAYCSNAGCKRRCRRKNYPDNTAYWVQPFEGGRLCKYYLTQNKQL